MNGEDLRIAHHEACHIVAAHNYGWRLNAVLRGRHWGMSLSSPRKDGVAAERALDAAVVLLAPFFEDPTGCEDDLRDVDGLIEYGVSLTAAWHAAAKLVANPEYRRKVRAIEAVLYKHTILSGEELELLLALQKEQQS